MSNHWSGRVSYTYAHCYDVASIIVDSNPRLDYGRCDRDNTTRLRRARNVDLGNGFGAGFVFRAYSGYPINETVGTDVNGDGTNNDRPMKGVNDLHAAIGFRRSCRRSIREAWRFATASTARRR